MVKIVWDFRVVAGKEAEFERNYGPDGTWVRLFRRSPEFLGTELLRDRQASGRYLTVDRWSNLAAYQQFMTRFQEEYNRIDIQMESLTLGETRVGEFESV